MNAFKELFGAEDYDTKVLFPCGAPSSATLREVATMMKDATLLQFNNFNGGNEEILQYGCISGNPDFKIELAKFLTGNYRHPVDSENLFINTGATQGFADLLSYYFQPGDTLFLGDPTYWTLLDTIKRSAEINIVPIKIDENGMNIDDLQTQVEAIEDKKITERHPFSAAVYIIPVYQNPTTVSLSPERCKQLVSLAQKHDLLVISDDVYNVLTYSASDCNDAMLAKPPVRLFHYDRESGPDFKGNVVSIGTFSKLLSPGLRLGWFEMPAKILRDFADSMVSFSGNGRNPYTSGIATAALQSGLVLKHVRKIRAKYAEKMKRAHDIISISLAKYGVRCTLPSGGIFMWISMPEGISADDVLKLCSKEMTFVTGKRCSFSGSCQNDMRICISFYEEDVLYPAISKLCEYIGKVIEDSTR